VGDSNEGSTDSETQPGAPADSGDPKEEPNDSTPSDDAKQSADDAVKSSDDSADAPEEPKDSPQDSSIAKDSASVALPVTARDEAVHAPNDSIGSISVGHPSVGFLFNGVRMPKDPKWVVTAPQHAWGTEETTQGIAHCIARVHEQFPMTPPAIIGSISPEHGGPAPPHKSHRSGRDADVYFYRLKPAKWYVAAKAEDLDRSRTWALLKCFITETDVDFVLIDRKPQAWLEEYALSIGEDPAWIQEIFHGSGPYPHPVVQHVPGHVAHMHVRFVSPIARERGRYAYDRLVEQGHLALVSKEERVIVAKGDTISRLAEKYRVSVEQIKKLNQLDSGVIRLGQVLIVRQAEDLRGARDPIVIPARRLPEVVRSNRAKSMAALVEVEREARAAIENPERDTGSKRATSTHASDSNAGQLPRSPSRSATEAR
jgi:LysM repeat protein